MASRGTIQTVKADFLDPLLYDDVGPNGLPRLTRASLLAPLSRAFDLAEGRRPGHALRVAYIGVTLAEDLQLSVDEVADVFFAGLLHDAGMAALAEKSESIRGPRIVPGMTDPRDLLASLADGNWAEVIEAMSLHCELGARVARRLGFNENVAHAIGSHHDCWDGSGPGRGGGANAPIVSRIIAAADRLESMIDSEPSPLIVRRRGPALVREMAGAELDPELAVRIARLASHDEFWIGFYDGDMSTSLMANGYGGEIEGPAFFEMLSVLSDVIDVRNGREIGRGRRVAALSWRLAQLCKLSERRADLVRTAALLQDIGTFGVPIAILSKPDILTVEEMTVVQQHPSLARDIVSEIPGLGAAAWWVGCHHERVDGKGYPGMLQGDEVPIEAQIIGVCEAYEALTSDRPYRRAMESDDALEVLRGLAGTRFVPTLVERFEDVATQVVA